MRETIETARSLLIVIEISLQPWDVLVSSLHQRHRLKNIYHYFEDNATLGTVCGNNENLVNCERESSCAIVVLQIFAHRKVPGNWRCNWCSSFRNICSAFSPVNRNAKLLKVTRRAHSTIEWKSSIWSKAIKISIAQFVWCQGWYTSRIWLQTQFQTWALTVEQNWGCQPTKWPDMIWHEIIHWLFW